MSNRKRGQILDCQYGFHWPLNNYTFGYVVMLSDADHIWTTNRGIAAAIASAIK